MANRCFRALHCTHYRDNYPRSPMHGACNDSTFFIGPSFSMERRQRFPVKWNNASLFPLAWKHFDTVEMALVRIVRGRAYGSQMPFFLPAASFSFSSGLTLWSTRLGRQRDCFPVPHPTAVVSRALEHEQWQLDGWHEVLFSLGCSVPAVTAGDILRTPGIERQPAS